jgi:hypothetical protein
LPSRIVSTQRRGTYVRAMFVLVLCGLTGCHKLRSQLAGTGDDPTGAPAAAGDSGKVKHLHLGGGGGQKTRSLLGGKHSESGEPSEAALARQSHHSMAPVFHWGDGSDGGAHHKSHSHF